MPFVILHYCLNLLQIIKKSKLNRLQVSRFHSKVCGVLRAISLIDGISQAQYCCVVCTNYMYQATPLTHISSQI